MEIQNYISEAIFIILFSFLVYYVIQKGKNLADKTDLKEITDIVEEVKNKYTQDNELLRANLSLLTSKKNVMFNEEKEAIIQYYAQLNKWIWDGLNISIIDYNHTNYSNIANKMIRMQDDHNQTNIAFAKLQLLCKDEAIVKAAHDANIKVLALHHFKERLIRRLYGILSKESILTQQILSGSLNNLSDQYRKTLEETAEEDKKEKDSIYDEYFIDHREHFKSAMNLKNNFMTLAKQYLEQT